MVSTARPLPTPGQLAALGAVLCQFKPHAGGELSGWTRAVRAAVSMDVDSDCVRESLHFYDARGQACWHLHLLPETDFLAWERACEALPVQQTTQPADGIVARLWRRAGERAPWQLDAMRLHTVSPEPGMAAISMLAASPAALSPLGAEAARRIARHAGIEAARAIDDCCCRQAAASMRHNAAVPGANPVIHFKRDPLA